MTNAYFVTGTDTEVGKTWVSAGLLRCAGHRGKRAIGYKPIAAGCERQGEQWVNDDALMLHSSSDPCVTLDEVNPIKLVEPIAPHIAAAREGITLADKDIIRGLDHLMTFQPELLLMEGAGGWRLPLGEGRFLSGVVRQLNMDVIIVVGMRLGCLNHALLTAEAIQADGLRIKGWVANTVGDTMPCYEENLATLDALMPAPRLAEIPFNRDPSVCAAALSGAIEKLT